MKKPEEKEPGIVFEDIGVHEAYICGYNKAFKECSLWILYKLEQIETVDQVKDLIKEIKEA